MNQPVNDNSTHPLVGAHQQARIAELNQYHNDLLRQLDVEKEHGIEDANKDDKGEKQSRLVEDLDAAFEVLSKTLHTKLNQMNLGGGGPLFSLLPPVNPPQIGSQVSPWPRLWL
ncbi:hypothetical protein ACOSQ3_013576 [Xanthoceras sorbifolium]